MSDIYTQPELPLAQMSLSEHKHTTGHSPVSVFLPDGWVCGLQDDGQTCESAWPPPVTREEKLRMVTCLFGRDPHRMTNDCEKVTDVG